MKSESVSLLSEPLPFKNYRLSAEHCAHVEERLRRWCDEHDFGDGRFVEVARVYLEFCSPPQPSLSGLDLLTDYLSWFFLLNDLPVGEKKEQQLAAARDAFHGTAFDGSLVATATVEFCRTIRERFGRDARERLERRLSDVLEALCWEAGQIGDPPPPLELFHAYREHTIGDYPYIELWRLGEEFAVHPRHWPAFTELERLNTRIIYLTNDILSAARDKTLNKLNPLFCLMHERGVDLEEAKWLCNDELRILVERCVSLSEAVRREGDVGSSAKKYVDFLSSNLEGNRITTFTLTHRYGLSSQSSVSMRVPNS